MEYGMEKLLTFPGKTDQGIFNFVIDTEREHLVKTAAEYHPEIKNYITSAQKIPGKTQILLTALGAGEWWGNNANGDYFPESGLSHFGRDYGYKTFEYYAKIYKHHVNKDPKASFGDVVLSVYNHVYHRVELILLLDNAKAPDIADRMASGEYPEWSMGARVPFDQCSICGNRAKTVKQYCDHLKYYMGRIHPGTGKIAYAINLTPRFFDISDVLIGADKIAKTLLKVAFKKSESGVYLPSAFLAQKSAAENKQAEIRKEIPIGAGNPPSSEDRVETILNALPEIKGREVSMPRPILDNVAQKHDLSKIFTTMSMMGIQPKPQEFQRIVLINIGKKDVANELDSQNKCFDPNSSFPSSKESIYRKLVGDMSGAGFNENILKTLSPFIQDRSCLQPHVTNRIIVLTKRACDYTEPEYIKLSAEQERDPVGMPALLLMLAGAYSLMSKGGKKIVENVPGFVVKHPGLAAALAVGAPMVAGSFFGPGSKGTVDVPTMGNQQQEIDRFSPQEIEKRLMKIGASKELMFSAGMVPGAYMASKWLNKRRQTDPYYQEGKIKSFIRKNPDLIAAVSGFNVLHKMTGGGAMKGVKSLFKTGSIVEDATNVALFPLALGSKALPGRMLGSALDHIVFDASRKMFPKKKNNIKVNK